ncbi:MAG: hypothetical protein LBJ73_01385 [Rickettsiales bacterium]|jgi:hypothetical protein|nr:hypothetical protein [Rickettsiales bacterium]
MAKISMKKVLLGLALAGMTAGGIAEIVDIVNEKLDDKYDTKWDKTRKEVVDAELRMEDNISEKKSEYTKKAKELDKKQMAIITKEIKGQDIVLPEDVYLSDGHGFITDYPIVVREIKKYTKTKLSDDNIYDVILELAMPGVPTYFPENGQNGQHILKQMSKQEKDKFKTYMNIKVWVAKYKEGDHIEFREDTPEYKIIKRIEKLIETTRERLKKQRTLLESSTELAIQKEHNTFVVTADSIWNANKIKADDRHTLSTDYFKGKDGQR